MKDKKDFTFKLVGMEVLQSSITEIVVPNSEKINFNFDLNIEIKFNTEKEVVFVAPSVSVRINNEPKQIGFLKIALMFEINSFNDYYNKETNEFILPKNIQDVFNSVSISTLRGVMFNCFKGTILHNAILPVIDPTKFNGK